MATQNADSFSALEAAGRYQHKTSSSPYHSVPILYEIFDANSHNQPEGSTLLIYNKVNLKSILKKNPRTFSYSKLFAKLDRGL